MHYKTMTFCELPRAKNTGRLDAPLKKFTFGNGRYIEEHIHRSC
jgi:hypothetical protein